MIYFIVDFKNMVCKVGYSKRPKRRLATIQSSYPYKLTLVKCIDGNIDDEKNLHFKYKDSRLSGEWFYVDAIDELKNELTESFYTEEKVCGIMVKIDKLSGMYNATDFINRINEIKLLQNKPIFNLSSWLNSKTTIIFIEELKNITKPIYRGSNTWVHKYLFHELTLAIGNEYKIDAYSYLLDKAKVKH